MVFEDFVSMMSSGEGGVIEEAVWVNVLNTCHYHVDLYHFSFYGSRVMGDR